MMSVIPQVIRENNLGVVEISEGNMMGGVQHLRNAVAALRNLSEAQPGPTKIQDQTHEETMKLPVFVPVPPKVSFDSSEVLQGALFLNETRVEEGDSEEVTVVCAAVIYNMAFAHHAYALQCEASATSTSLNSDQFIDKALQLYHKAMGIVERISSASSVAVELVALSTLNNACHLYSLKLDFERVQRIAEAMISVLSSTGAIRRGEHDQTFSFFFLNAIFFKERHRFASAA